MKDYGKMLEPLFKPVKYIATACSSSTKVFKKEYEEAEEIGEE